MNSILTVPAEQAKLLAYPPGCPVLCSGDALSATIADADSCLGVVESISIDLLSKDRSYQYRVRLSTKGEAARGEGGVLEATFLEEALSFAPPARVYVNKRVHPLSSKALAPDGVDKCSGGAPDAKEWMEGSVLLGYDARFVRDCYGGSGGGGKREMLYSVEIQRGPNKWLRLNGIPKCHLRYRGPSPPERWECPQSGGVCAESGTRGTVDHDALLSSTGHQPGCKNAATKNKTNSAQSIFEAQHKAESRKNTGSDETPAGPLSPPVSEGTIQVGSHTASSETVSANDKQKRPLWLEDPRKIVMSNDGMKADNAPSVSGSVSSSPRPKNKQRPSDLTFGAQVTLNRDNGTVVRRLNVPLWLSESYDLVKRHIIGPGGKDRRRLESQTECRIVLRGKCSGCRTTGHEDHLYVLIDGVDELTQKAAGIIRDMLVNFVDEDSRRRIITDLARGCHDSGAVYLPSLTKPSEWFWMDYIEFPCHISNPGCVIGSKGCVIQALRKETNCFLKIHGFSRGHMMSRPYVRIEGDSKESVERAMVLVSSKFITA